MDVIKFRGYDPERKAWVYGSLMQVQSSNYILSSDVMNAGFSLDKIHYVDRDSLGLFLGMYDVNHREVYEGDLLKLKGSSAVYEVRYVRGVFAYLENGDLDKELITNASLHEWAIVVGNVYEKRRSEAE